MSKNFELGKEYYDNEDYAKAIEFLKKAKDEKEDAETCRLIGLSYCMLEDDSNAMFHYFMSIAIDPDYAATYNNIGWLYQRMNAFPLAIENYDKAIKLDPSFAVAYNNRGKLYGFLEKNDLALNDFREALKLCPNEPFYLKNAGIMLTIKGENDEGFDMLMKAVQLNLEDAHVYDYIGQNYQKFSDYKKADIYFTKAITLNPTDSFIKEHYESNKELLTRFKMKQEDSIVRSLLVYGCLIMYLVFVYVFSGPYIEDMLRWDEIYNDELFMLFGMCISGLIIASFILIKWVSFDDRAKIMKISCFFYPIICLVMLSLNGLKYGLGTVVLFGVAGIGMYFLHLYGEDAVRRK